MKVTTARLVVARFGAPAIPLPEFDAEPQSLQVPSYEKVLQIRKEKLNPGLVTYYRKPLYITQGSKQWLWNEKGERFLDLFGGIVTVSVGHCHPKVNAALNDQAGKLWHTTNIYMHPKVHEYAEKLTAKLPKGLDNVYFVNSGSEANDLALLMARVHTGNFDSITLRNSYHGMSYQTMGMTAHSTWKYNTPMGIGIHHAMNPDPYIGVFGGKKCRDSPVQVLGRECNCTGDQCKASADYIQQLEEIFKYSTPKGRSIAAFFAESIQGVGGTVQFPKGYLKAAFEKVREAGGVCVSDEVQTGFGRTGEHFWGFQGHGVVPDIVTMAKGMGNGMPMGAVITSREIAASITKALHFNTFGGNPLSSAVGMAVMDIIEEEKLQQNSFDVGTRLLKGLEALRDEFEIVGDVRGKGLMIGVEMVVDKSTKEPLDAQRMGDIWEDCKNMRVLFGKGGLNGNVIRIKPPMCINNKDVDFTLNVLRIALDKTSKK